MTQPATPPPDRATTADRPTRGAAQAGLGFGAVALMLLCCAGPALLAAGALGSLGAILGNPLVILAGSVVAAAAVIGAGRRHSRGAACCTSKHDGRPGHDEARQHG
ncbi:MAG: hypothetical protein ACRD0N_00285 [Acidimicrobiales bacterium]